MASVVSVMVRSWSVLARHGGHSTASGLGNSRGRTWVGKGVGGSSSPGMRHPTPQASRPSCVGRTTTAADDPISPSFHRVSP
jgi:hypothetical protein